MIKRIVVLLTGTPNDQSAAQTATLVARRLGASVEGLSIKIDPTELMFRLGEGVSAESIDEIIKAAEKNSDEAAARGRATLEAAAKAQGLKWQNSLPDSTSQGAYAREVQGPVMDVLSAQMGLADLVVFGELGEKAPLDLAAKVEHTLLHMRRPVLIARGKIAPTIGDKVLLPFNGTVEACAALSRAMSLILSARSVEILHLAEGQSDLSIAEDARRYIRQHGGEATISEQKPSGKGIGEDIVARANAIGADLVVMGGYGRSRLRELVLGGATRHMIMHSPLPVLLAH
ncbi:MAG: universal stress protein [Alphaproteobacteria bacterium]